MKHNSNVQKKQSVFGPPAMEQITRRGIHKPLFTARTDNPEQTERLTALAEQAVEAKGMVFAKRDKNKNCVCWVIVTVITDGKVGKKILRHYELTALEAAAGYEDCLPELEKEIIRILKGQLLLTSRVQTAHVSGQVYTAADAEKSTRKVRPGSLNFWIALSAALLIGVSLKNAGLGILYFLIFSRLDYGGKKEQHQPGQNNSHDQEDAS